MKILKRIFIGLLSLIGLIIIFLAGSLLIDNWNTSYLKVKKHDGVATNNYLIKNVNVVPMTADTVLANMDIKVVDGIIEMVGSNLDAEDLEIIDGNGAYVSPGLIDMHVHVWDRYELGLYLANGVTTVRNLWGQPMHLRMKEDINQEKILAPIFFTSSPKLTGPVFMGDDNLNLFTKIDAKTRVADYKKRGYDFIKTYYGLTEELFDAVLEQAIESDMEIAAHPTNEVAYSYHFKDQIKTIEHAEDIVQQPLEYQLDTAKLNEVVELYASNPNSTLCPTITVYYNIYRLLTEESILSNPELSMMNPLIKMVDSEAQFNRWQGTKANDETITQRIKDQHEFHLLAIRKLHENGVNIVAGTDAGIGVTVPGYSIHAELDFYKKAGMTNYEALKTATINPTKTHSFLRNLGSIESGKIANLLFTKENPLNDLSTLHSPQNVMIRGRQLSRETLDQFTEKAMDRSNLIASGLRYAENLVIEK